MSDSQKHLDLQNLQRTMLTWLKDNTTEDGYEWVKLTSERLHKKAEDWEFFSSFSAVPRYTGKQVLDLTTEQQEQADALRSGWKPQLWTADQLGRTLMILSISSSDKKEFLDKLEKTFISSDVGEAVALYQSIPVLPYPEDLRQRAAEGIRSNMTSVFNAVALRNPYPAEYLDEDAWNQMVLKALFVESPIYLIQGIDKRANEKLAHMLVDYAHERWAADRSVSPELWRAVGPFASGDIIDDLKKVLAHQDVVHQQAALLALSASSSEQGRDLIEQNAESLKQIEQGKITWNHIGRQVNKS